VLPFSFVKE